MRALAESDGTGRRTLAGATLRAVLDLLIAGQARGAPADSQARDLALASELAALADEASAQAAAGRIVAAGLPLPEITEALLRRGGGAALTLMAHSPDVAEPWRQRALLADDPRLAAAMATRADLSESEQEALVQRGETAVLAALAGNSKVRLARAALQHLLAAGPNREIGRALLTRTDLDAATLLPLYRLADAEQRAAMRAAIAERASLRGITLKHADATAEDTERLLEAALQGIEPLTACVAALCGQGAAFVDALRADADRDLLALALVALDVAPEIATRLILRVGDDLARDSRRVMATVAILRETPRTVAIAILAAQWPRAPARDASAPRTAPVHQPAMAPGGSAARETPREPSQDPARETAPGTGAQRRRGAAATLDALKNRG
jgi:hypothetical protein